MPFELDVQDHQDWKDEGSVLPQHPLVVWYSDGLFLGGGI